jgi:hypothetical protein
MPKTDIDYNNTIIYKITCCDETIKDVYVGHTTNFVQRKHAHKQGCNNEKSSNYNCKLYNTIREHGGWKNWKMEIINFFNCRDHYEARQKEQEYFVSLNATLNSIEPMPKPKPKEQPKVNETILTQQVQSNKFCCESCDYNTSNKKDYNKHLLTAKHAKAIECYTNAIQNFHCLCGKDFVHASSYYRHKKKCNGEQIKATIPDTIDQPSIMQIIQQNDELKALLIEQNKMIIEQNNKIMDFYKNLGNNACL